MNKNTIRQKISQLKINLESTDYKIIKCYESSLLNEETPYDLQELLSIRKNWRIEIDSLEFQLALAPEEPEIIEEELQESSENTI
jgi:hypothetical protein